MLQPDEVLGDTPNGVSPSIVRAKTRVVNGRAYPAGLREPIDGRVPKAKTRRARRRHRESAGVRGGRKLAKIALRITAVGIVEDHGCTTGPQHPRDLADVAVGEAGPDQVGKDVGRQHEVEALRRDAGEIVTGALQEAHVGLLVSPPRLGHHPVREVAAEDGTDARRQGGRETADAAAEVEDVVARPDQSPGLQRVDDLGGRCVEQIGIAERVKGDSRFRSGLGEAVESPPPMVQGLVRRSAGGQMIDAVGHAVDHLPGVGMREEQALDRGGGGRQAGSSTGTSASASAAAARDGASIKSCIRATLAGIAWRSRAASASAIRRAHEPAASAEDPAQVRAVEGTPFVFVGLLPPQQVEPPGAVPHHPVHRRRPSARFQGSRRRNRGRTRRGRRRASRPASSRRRRPRPAFRCGPASRRAAHARQASGGRAMIGLDQRDRPARPPRRGFPSARHAAGPGLRGKAGAVVASAVSTRPPRRATLWRAMRSLRSLRGGITSSMPHAPPGHASTGHWLCGASASTQSSGARQSSAVASGISSSSETWSQSDATARAFEDGGARLPLAAGDRQHVEVVADADAEREKAPARLFEIERRQGHQASLAPHRSGSERTGREDVPPGQEPGGRPERCRGGHACQSAHHSASSACEHDRRRSARSAGRRSRARSARAGDKGRNSLRSCDFRRSGRSATARHASGSMVSQSAMARRHGVRGLDEETGPARQDRVAQGAVGRGDDGRAAGRGLAGHERRGLLREAGHKQASGRGEEPSLACEPDGSDEPALPIEQRPDLGLVSNPDAPHRRRVRPRPAAGHRLDAPPGAPGERPFPGRSAQGRARNDAWHDAPGASTPGCRSRPAAANRATRDRPRAATPRRS